MRERLIAKGFTNKRVTDAVNYVIDTCKYPTPTVADFVGYDKKVKLYTYNEACNELGIGLQLDREFAPVKVNGLEKPLWVRKVDKKNYNLPDEI